MRAKLRIECNVLTFFQLQNPEATPSRAKNWKIRGKIAILILKTLINACMQDSFARARTRPRPSARATIGYLVYKINAGVEISYSTVNLVYNISHRLARDRPGPSLYLIYVVYHYSRAKRASADRWNTAYIKVCIQDTLTSRARLA